MCFCHRLLKAYPDRHSTRCRQKGLSRPEYQYPAQVASVATDEPDKSPCEQALHCPNDSAMRLGQEQVSELPPEARRDLAPKVSEEK
jgi:hypothetical protein